MTTFAEWEAQLRCNVHNRVQRFVCDCVVARNVGIPDRVIFESNIELAATTIATFIGAYPLDGLTVISKSFSIELVEVFESPTENDEDGITINRIMNTPSLQSWTSLRYGRCHAHRATLS
jgi:hypothetical protein